MAERLLEEQDDETAHAVALDRWRNAQGRDDRSDAEFWCAVVASVEEMIGKHELGRAATIAPPSYDGKAP